MKEPRHRTNAHRTNAVAALAALIALALAGCGLTGDEPSPTSTPDAAAAPTEAVDAEVRQVVTADGALVLPVPPQTIAFPAGGTVLDVPVTEGDRVVADQVLAQMDPLPLERAAAEARGALATAREQLETVERGTGSAEVQSARAEVQSAAAALERLEAGTDLELARLELDRARNSLWGSQAQRDATCGLTDQGLATQAACDQAQASVQAAEDAVRIAERNLAAREASADEDLAAARARLGAAQARLNEAGRGPSEAALEAAQSRVEQAQRALQQAEADLERAILQAPFDATVTQVHVASGVQVAPGEPVVTIAKTDPLRFATTNVSERNVGQIRTGAEATVTFTAYPDRPVPATVQRVAGQSTEGAGGATVFTVYLDVEPEEDMELRAGMTGRVEIVTEE